MEWYYASNNQPVGPLSQEDFDQRAAAGEITPETLVWREGMTDWVAYGSLTEAAPTTALAPVTAAAPADGEGVAFERGQTPNADLTAAARASLGGLWGIAIAACLVVPVISIACQFVPLAGPILFLLLSGPLSTGLATFFLALIRRSEEPRMGMVFQAFNRFGTTLGAYLLMNLFVFLWSLLLIIPGIVAYHAYAMTFYILADDPSVGSMEAIRRSKAMMQGRKWKLFCLSCRFIGWAFLCVFTLGIGFLWLSPYMSASFAQFYEDVRE